MTTSHKPIKPSSMPSSPSGSGDGNRLFALVVTALIVLGVALVAVVASSRDIASTAAQTSTVSLTGQALDRLPFDVPVTSSDTDPEAGSVAPSLSGTDFQGNPVTIEADGRAKAIYFLAHWCPHCQDEVPAVQRLVAQGALPDGMDVYAVSTGVDIGRGNYPPEIWLADEGFEPPTIRDDNNSSAFATFGGSSFPYAVYLDTDHRVVARSAGQLGPEAIAALWVATVAER